MYIFRWVVRRRRRRVRARANTKEFLRHKEKARTLATSRIAHFNQWYGFSYGRISIKNQRTRWGSCSEKGNLNFNYKIALLPPHLADYIIVHELCHLGEFNHSRRFWQLVERVMPDWRTYRDALRKTDTRFLS